MTPQPDLTDHDMLIRIDTTVTAMSGKLSSLCQRLDAGDKEREEIVGRVIVLETDAVTLKDNAKQDRWIERLGIIIGTGIATALGLQK